MNEAIVLAGGFGTRLREVVSDVPKPMAPVKGRPFLAYILEYLASQNIAKVILATGYKHQSIADHFGNHFRDIVLSYSIEDTPLGTGGAIRKALAQTTGPHVYILNGDTFFCVDFLALWKAHQSSAADVTLTLKWRTETDRYGRVLVESNVVTGFLEKEDGGSGFINGGVYLTHCNLFAGLALPERFSFENDFLARHYQQLRFGVCCAEGFFIDIGIPEDYRRAQTEMGTVHE